MMKTLLIITGILFVGTVLNIGTYVISLQKVNTKTPLVVLSLPTPDPINNIKVQKSTDAHVKSLPNITSVKKLDNGNTEYIINPGNVVRKDQVLTKDGIVIFKRTIASSVSSSGDYVTIPQYIQQLGPAEKTVTGSLYYGDHATTYMYATKGIAFIGNSVTGDVFEIQQFQPMSVDSYMSLYGQDVHEVNPNQPRGE